MTVTTTTAFVSAKTSAQAHQRRSIWPTASSLRHWTVLTRCGAGHEHELSVCAHVRTMQLDLSSPDEAQIGIDALLFTAGKHQIATAQVTLHDMAAALG